MSEQQFNEIEIYNPTGEELLGLLSNAFG